MIVITENAIIDIITPLIPLPQLLQHFHKHGLALLLSAERHSPPIAVTCWNRCVVFDVENFNHGRQLEHGRKSRGEEEQGRRVPQNLEWEKANAIRIPPNFVMFQNFKHQIACNAMQ